MTDNGKNAEHARPANANSPMPLRGPPIVGTSKKAATIITGKAVQTMAGATTATNAEISSRPATSAPQNADRP